MISDAIEKGLFRSGLLISLGLVVELAMSWSVHPLAFVTFALIACPLVAAGILLFLWTLAST